MPTYTRPPVTASGVSRSLHSQGFRPSNPARKYKDEGVFVENGLKILGTVYEVRISVQIEAQRRREELAEDMATALRGRGYVVEVRHNGIAAYSNLIVTRPAVTA
jgi:hypothetical protein